MTSPRRWAKAATLLFARLQSVRSVADIAMFHEFVPPPYGGGNQFLWGLRRALERRRWRIETNTISRSTQACLFNSFNFDFDRLTALQRDGCRMVHRVDGPIAAYRGVEEGLDYRIWEFNALADATVFQSEYSRRRHEEMGLHFRAPTVIHNAADPEIFHPRRTEPLFNGPRIRLIATSWSDNVNKGADVYEWLDAHLDFRRFEFTFVGRTKSVFRRIRVVPPLPSEGVADELRRHDIFVIASRNEPCSNALIEAMSCGLPVAFLDSGSHGELVRGGGVSFTTPDDVPGVLERLVANHAEFVSRLEPPDLSHVTDRYLESMGLPPTAP